MPDTSITAPAVTDPIDRLTLEATDARSAATATSAICATTCGCNGCNTACMAEE